MPPCCLQLNTSQPPVSQVLSQNLELVVNFCRITKDSLQSSMQYEKHHFELLAIYRHNGDLNPHKTNNFSGPPRPELEEAWDKLLKNADIRVSQEELGEFAGDDSIIKLSDDSGYYVTVSAFHGLHCVQRLHMYMFAEHYYTGLSEYELFMLRRHTEHCLDWLRQHVQCHADPTFIPIHWTTNDAGPVAADDGTHQCANWEKVEQWMADRSFDPFEPGLLVHPIFGERQMFNFSFISSLK
ncbi:hypothetical protein BO71DRAFT_477182 [Aspergillus ellipticus CBS 707.79]|uniref:Tat pathway signal sequence n=1 Tax=Aspergillus ellipticus CBS 707.79 TaxID=1448320 RepID=A0A319EST1_9EURO|nr:hypothetical protein BO71DRAFT_477182 [Aspergillus ellipticus CBS 707.79]